MFTFLSFKKSHIASTKLVNIKLLNIKYTMKTKSTKESRLKLAKYLNEHLCSFGDHFNDVIICPTCLSRLDLNRDQDKFSAGHIIPEAAGGDEWTFLCNTCNSEFGRKQDKWFGEYLHILNNPKGTFLNAKTKGKYISVNGQTVRGDINISRDGSIEIFLPIDRNPPGKVKSIKMDTTLVVSFKPELIDHENEIEVGYITAAYLTWFHEIGYNWIFQSSLDVVRRQIVECNRNLDGAKIIDLDTHKLEIQGIGIINQSGFTYPCCIVIDKIVVFPAPSTTNAPTPKKISFDSPCNIDFLKLAIMNLPYITLYDGGQVVVPDQLTKSIPIPNLALYIYSDNGKKPEWLTIELDNTGKGTGDIFFK
jgi:hypothetical protein